MASAAAPLYCPVSSVDDYSTLAGSPSSLLLRYLGLFSHSGDERRVISGSISLSLKRPLSSDLFFFTLPPLFRLCTLDHYSKALHFAND